jgi:tetratricopeptide (TPR) repeat protein
MRFSDILANWLLIAKLCRRRSMAIKTRSLRSSRNSSRSLPENSVKRYSFSTASFGCVVLLMLFVVKGLSQTNPIVAAQIRTYMDRAQAALRANRPDVAADQYRAVLKLDPKNIEARANLGVVAMSKGDWSGAAEEFDAALKLQPSQSKVQGLLGLCEIRLGQVDEAQKLLTEAFPKLEEPKLKRETGMTLLEIDFQRGEFDKASAILVPLQEMDPNDAAISYADFRVYSELAYQSIESLAVNSPDSAQLHRALAEHLVNDGRTDAAIIEYRKALSTAPSVPELHFELGQAIVADSHLEANLAEAQQEFETSLRLNPSNAHCECALADVELLRTKSAEAALHFGKALKIDPESACAKAGLAAQLIDSGKEQQALEYLEAAVRGDPYNAQLHYRLGVLYRHLGNKEGAAKETDSFKHLKDIEEELQRVLHPKPQAE